VATVDAAGKNCTETCTNNKMKPCGGWSSCWDKNVSCSSSGIDQDGRPCQGCCFSCDVVCEPGPDPDQPPTISSTIICPMWGSNGWCVGNESLDLTASDPQGYTLTITGSIGGTPFTCASGKTCSKSLPDGNGTINYSVTASQSGKSADGTNSWKRDTTPPTVTQAIPSPTGSNGWFNTVPVTVSASGSDTTSGLASAQVSINGGAWQSSARLDLDGVYAVDFQALDRAGNPDTTTKTVNIDTTPPLFIASTHGTMGNPPWFISEATTTISPSDDLSGVSSVEYSENGAVWQKGSAIFSKDGVNAISVRVFDMAGNVASDLLSVSVDTVPPTIAPSVAGTAGLNNWITSIGTASAVVGDATSGVGAGVEISMDNGISWQSAPISLNDGIYRLDFRAFDIAGNEGTASLNASIDTIDPDLEFVLDGTLGTHGWYVSDVNVSAMAADNLSGVDYSNVRADGGAWSLEQNLSDGVHDLEAQAVDLAGHTKTISRALRIDTMSPSSLFTSHTNNEVVAGMVKVEGGSSDTLSGMFGMEISTDGGATWNAPTLSDGSWSYDWNTTALQNDIYTVKIRGIDVAGNREFPVPLTLLVDNFPPHVKITDSWWIWESGEFIISSNNFSIGEIKVTISDPMNRWPAVKFSYDTDTTLANITWDRRFADGTLAPSGNYHATVLACDIYGNCASDRGVIKVPFLAPIPPTATPMSTMPPTPVSTMTMPPSPVPQVQSVIPQATNVEATQPEQEQLTVTVHPVSALQVLVVVVFIALMWALSLAALADPRPKAILAIAKTISQRKDRV